jgi:hypothetical protein
MCGGSSPDQRFPKTTQPFPIVNEYRSWCTLVIVEKFQSYIVPGRFLGRMIPAECGELGVTATRLLPDIGFRDWLRKQVYFNMLDRYLM